MSGAFSLIIVNLLNCICRDDGAGCLVATSVVKAVIYSLRFGGQKWKIGVTGQQSRCQGVSSGGCRRNWAAIGGSWLVAISLQFLPIWTHYLLFFCLFQPPPSLSLVRTLVFGFSAHAITQGNFPSSRFLTSSNQQRPFFLIR